MVEGSAPRARNPVLPGSSPAPTTSCFFFGSPEFSSSATLITNQLVASSQLGILVLYVRFEFFFRIN